MSSHDPLWSPEQPGDADLKRIETLLRGYRHDASVPGRWSRRAPPRRRRVLMRAAAACVAVLVLAVVAWLPWRLHWNEGAAWPVAQGAGAERIGLAVGDSIATSAGQGVRVGVARIGAVTLSPDSRMRLLETRTGHHRVSLERGHMHARVWAPPGYFGVQVDGAEVVDLGCEFDVWKDADGRGRIAVDSGWVMHAVGGQETLVPEGHAMQFGRERAGIPLRAHASEAFKEAVATLDAAMHAGARDAGGEAAVARLAGAGDAHSVLALLTRYPGLASGPLYPRLASLLGVPSDDLRHRQAWAAGSIHAIDAWWTLMPRPPKQWWRNWADAIP